MRAYLKALIVKPETLAKHATMKPVPSKVTHKTHPDLAHLTRPEYCKEIMRRRRKAEKLKR